MAKKKKPKVDEEEALEVKDFRDDAYEFSESSGHSDHHDHDHDEIITGNKIGG